MSINPISMLNQGKKKEEEYIYAYVQELLDPTKREFALSELARIREEYEDMALVLWNSFGVMASLIQEVVSVYPLLDPPLLTTENCTRICNCLTLLQCIASHPKTRLSFLSSNFPIFLFPFLNTNYNSKSYDHLRLSTLGVIGAIVKNDNPEVIRFFLSTEIVPLCLKIMETGNEITKTVAIFIIQKILADKEGLNYVCETYERFITLTGILNQMVSQLVENLSVRILKHVIKCYYYLSENTKARTALRQFLPDPLRDASFSPVIKDDPNMKRLLTQLLVNLSDNIVTQN